MIHTIRTVAVGDQESKIDSPIIPYRGDREVEVEFTINGGYNNIKIDSNGKMEIIVSRTVVANETYFECGMTYLTRG